MHMSDVLLSPAVGGLMWVGSMATVAVAARKVTVDIQEPVVPLMGVAGAFVFAAQMVTFAIPGTGSSGHLSGTLLLSILLGPHPAFLVMVSVLAVQALFFADGGLLALGCNIWNVAMYPCYVAYPLVVRPLIQGRPTAGRTWTASLLGGIVALQLGACSVVLQTSLSGRTELPFWPFLLVMQPIHLAIGAIEGIITAGILQSMQRMHPEIVTFRAGPAAARARRTVTVSLFALALVTGSIVSWFASSNPDGLEWAIQRVSGVARLGEPTGPLRAFLRILQERTAILPDYTFATSPGGQGGWPRMDVGVSLSGVLGAALIIVAMTAVGLAVRVLRRRGRSGKARSALAGAR